MHSSDQSPLSPCINSNIFVVYPAMENGDRTPEGTCFLVCLFGL